MPAYTEVKCPFCSTSEVGKMGFTLQDKQRYRCYNNKYFRQSFINSYKNQGYLLAVKDKIIEMLLNGSGICDTSRVLKVSTWLVMNKLKKGLQSQES